MLYLKHISGILGQFTSFLQKELVLLIILLPLDKILKIFCVLLFKNVLADVYIYTHAHTHTGELCCLAGQLLLDL